MIFARRALLETGWAHDVRISLEGGRIGAVRIGAGARPGDAAVDTLLPAPGNLHSHTFQRAMAGMTEYRAKGRDNFWTWRELMYRFLDRLTPDQIEAIAALAFVEMQEAGFAAVAEFHYVHHQPGGQAYDNIAETGERIMAAASATGIGLTHLPVLYTHGGAGQQALAGGQKRFGCDITAFARLLEASRAAARALPPDTVVGVAPHSLRAIAPADLGPVAALGAGGPVHMHISEQPKEVADVNAWLGARPVDWLLANAAVDAHWCLIHASHMTEAETLALARSGAVAGLCAVTEANLGDGPFNGPDWIGAGGAYGIGTDSNIRISALDELRAVEYAQRLRDLARNVMVVGEGSVGASLWRGAARGGAQALGRRSGAIAAGNWADLLAVDSGHPTLCALAEEQLLDGLVFAAAPGVVSDLWSAGRHQVRQGRHIAREAVVAGYRRAMAQLMAEI